MDFVSDSLANARRLKCLTVADDFSHKCVDITVDYGISGECVTGRVPPVLFAHQTLANKEIP